MDAVAKVTSNGQVTAPKAVRDARGITEGDEIVFRGEDNQAVLARTPIQSARTSLIAFRPIVTVDPCCCSTFAGVHDRRQHPPVPEQGAALLDYGR